MNHTPVLLSFAMFLGAAAPSEAQRLAPARFATWEPAHPSAPVGLIAADTTSVRTGDHRVEGAVIGGVLLGVVGALVGNEICQNAAEPAGSGGSSSCTDATIGSGLIGAIIGGTIGYFIGKSTPKH